MWAAPKGFARMDREMRAGNWLRSDGVQLTGKTLGLIGHPTTIARGGKALYGAPLQHQSRLSQEVVFAPLWFPRLPRS